MRKFKCSVCGYIYDEAVGIPEKGIAPGTKWEEMADFVCPVCTAPKSVFKLVSPPEPVPSYEDKIAHVEEVENIRELSAGEISAICSSLAKGCEKQRLMDAMEAFNKIAEYYKKAVARENKTLGDALQMLDGDIEKRFASADSAAKAASDRGALRALVWSGKVSAMQKALLERYAKEGDTMLENTKVYVCDICGFIMLGDTPPDVCPVCKVPSFKIMQIERR